MTSPCWREGWGFLAGGPGGACVEVVLGAAIGFPPCRPAGHVHDVNI